MEEDWNLYYWKTKNQTQKWDQTKTAIETKYNNFVFSFGVPSANSKQEINNFLDLKGKQNMQYSYWLSFNYKA